MKILSAKHNKLRNPVSLVLMAMVLTACGGGGGGSGDATAPTVIVSPADGATDVERNVVLTATFDEDMFASTIDGNSFSLSDGSDVAGTVSFDAINNIASFTPDNELALLTEHTASLTAGITDLAGNALSAGSISFTTRDGVWGDSILLENDINDISSNPAELAFDANGNAIAIWSQTFTTRLSIYASHYLKGTGWGAPVLLEVSTYIASQPQVAMNDNGDAIAVWQQTSATSSNIWASHYDGTSWSVPALIETDDTGSAGFPQINIDNSGNALAVWRHHDGTRNNVMANRYTAGDGWGTAALIESVDTDNVSGIKMAMDGSGNALVVWDQYDGNRDNIWANRFDSNTTSWDGAVQIDNNDTGGAYTAQITMNDAGNAVAIWQQRDGIDDNIAANTYIAGSGWGTAEVIDNRTERADYMNVAIDANGNALAIWQQSDGAFESVYSNYYTAGSGWGTPELIESSDNAVPYDSLIQIAMDANGNGIATWPFYYATPGYSNIAVNRYVAGSGWSGVTLVHDNVGTTDYADYPNIFIDSSGNGVLTYTQPDSGADSVWTKRFE